METLLAALGGYLLGSIPFGLVLTKAAGLGDIRSIGSGNIGATNVLRTGNKKLAAATLILDGVKGAVAVLLALWLASEDIALIAGLFAVLGHNFPVWLKFKGGKGVATTLGTMMAVSWPTGLLCIATWLITAKLFRISSLAALVALGASPLYAYFFASPRHAALALVLAVLGMARHRANIERLMAGTEPKIGEKKQSSDKT
ncbi:MAG: glycerol-3-phosphate 1-O-acyltransferase PlsY [Alphaproteobacteria bacterium]|nr:glycerol-3-phosphate 1-O-acyltransferase PlsY [Alphaproteobacteria bacterium]